MAEEEIFRPSMLLDDPIYVVEHPKLGTIRFRELTVAEVMEFMKIEDLSERGGRMTVRRLAKANPDMVESEFTDGRINYLMLDEIAAAIQEYQKKHFRVSRLGLESMSMPSP